MSFVINPETNRLIKVGGPSYRRLMKKQLAQQQREAMESGEPTLYATNSKEELDPYAELGYTQHQPNSATLRMPSLKKATKKSKIGKRRMRNQPTQEEMSSYTANAATRAVNENMGQLADMSANCKTPEDLKDLENVLQKMILTKMLERQEGTADVQRSNRLKTMQSGIQKSKAFRQDYQHPQECEYELEEATENEYENE